MLRGRGGVLSSSPTSKILGERKDEWQRVIRKIGLGEGNKKEALSTAQ